MKERVLMCVLGLGGVASLAGAQHAALTPRDSALHALNRLAYGPRPGDIDRVAALGVMKWIDRQLRPEKIDDGLLAARERQFTILDYDRGQLARLYVEVQRERRERKRDARTAMDSTVREQRGRRMAAEFQELDVV